MILCRSSLSKVGALLAAVMVVLACMCPIAFADEVAPDGIEITTSPFSFSGTGYATYYVPAAGIESITFEGLYGFSTVMGWDGSAWVNTGITDVADSVTFSPADYPQYSAFSPVMGSTAAVRDTVVTFERIAPLKRVTGIVTGFASLMFDIGSDFIAWLTANPLACISIVLFLLVAFIGGVTRFIK